MHLWRVIERSQLALMLLVVIRQVSDAKALTPTETFILSLVEEKTEQTTTFLNKFEHQQSNMLDYFCLVCLIKSIYTYLLYIQNVGTMKILN